MQISQLVARTPTLQAPHETRTISYKMVARPSLWMVILVAVHQELSAYVAVVVAVSVAVVVAVSFDVAFFLASPVAAVVFPVAVAVFLVLAPAFVAFAFVGPVVAIVPFSSVVGAANFLPLASQLVPWQDGDIFVFLVLISLDCRPLHNVHYHVQKTGKVWSPPQRFCCENFPRQQSYPRQSWD